MEELVVVVTGREATDVDPRAGAVRDLDPELGIEGACVHAATPSITVIGLCLRSPSRGLRRFGG